jgi:DmsE family decaheme c-type cytochrome
MSIVSVGVMSARARTTRKDLIRSTFRSTLVAAAVFTAAMAGSASASPQDEVVSELRNFIQTAATQPAPASQEIAALNEFVRGAAAKPAGVKVADADNLFDALQQWSGQQNGTGAQAQVPVARPAKAAKVADAAYVGSKTCLGCHAAVSEKFQHTLMGRLQLQGKMQCESCHGPGSEHARLGGGRGVGGIISFRAEDPNFNIEEGNQLCLGCHLKGERVYWPGSAHETRGVACTNCHTVMKPVSRKFQLRTAEQMDTCFQCHKDIRAKQVRSSHMPLREGKMVCSDCHNPHGSPTEKLLRTATLNETCYKCHAEKRGPFLFEHAPVRENCANCHDPHGSVNEYMLKIARPRLCTECHAFGHGTTSGPLAVQTIGRQCQNCHTEVHGTNSPSGPLLHR